MFVTRAKGLGLLYRGGLGVAKDYAQAAAWFHKAAAAGSAFGMYHLATCYENGAGVPKDLAEATRYYEKAAALGNADAKARLAASPRGDSAAGGIHMAGNQQWTDTGIAMKAGDMVTVTASGSITLPAAQHIPPMTPSGSSANCKAAAALYGSSPKAPASQLACWSLIGRVGVNGPIGGIDASRTFHAIAPGEL